VTVFPLRVRIGQIQKLLIVFSNDRVTEQEILAGHFVSTARRVLSSAEETFLVLHDMTPVNSPTIGVKRAIWVSFPNFPMANHGLIPTLIAD
jgi:hypothetical protein